MKRWLVIAVFAAGIFATEGRGQCGGTPGFTLSTTPGSVGIGEDVTFALDTPSAALATWLFSTGPGPIQSPFGTLCLDFPFAFFYTFAVPDGGLSFTTSIPCDDSLLSLQLFHQFVAISTVNPNERGVSNQSAISFQPSPWFCDAFSDFSDVSELTLNGTAQQANVALRLTPILASSAGTAFYTMPANIDNDTSFETRFVYRIRGAGDGADGMTFIIQGNDEFQLGASGGGLGYGGIPNSLAIEIDNYQNGTDPDANHIGVLTGGDVDNHLATYTPTFDLENAQPHAVWICYDGPNNTLDVYLSETPVSRRPSQPIISLSNIDLPALMGSGQAWVGFSGGTGGVQNIHDAEKWSFRIGNY